MTPKSPRRPIYAWALYDWANSAFATVVLAGFFPILFRDHFSEGRADDEITLSLGIANSLGAALVIVLAPLVGALSDAAGRRKAPLMFCIVTGASATAALAWLEAGAWQLAAMIYIAATTAFALGNVFYDAMLTQVSAPHERASASSLGFALGYLGGGVLLMALVYMVFEAASFGFAERHEVMLFGFTATAVWWVVFSAPLLIFVAEPRAAGRLKDGFRRLAGTWRDLRANKTALWFLVAYVLYIDGVDTIIRMAANYGQTLGFSASDLILSLLLVQFIGFPATLAYGPLARRFGIRAMLLFLIGAYVVLCVAAARMYTLAHFFSVALAIGLFQGGIQALSRAYFSQLIPAGDEARFFGIYNLIGKAAVFIGPLVVGVVGAWSGSPRLGILSIVAFLLAGGAVLLWKVKETPQEAVKQARKSP